MEFKMYLKLYGILLIVSLNTILSGQIKNDLDVIHRIKNEAIKNSEVLNSAIFICDVHGPRLTRSPGFTKAANWTINKLKEWGIANAKLDSWGTFGRGWQVENVTAEMIRPNYMPLIAYPKSWTASTKGTIKGNPIILDYTTFEDVEKLKGTLEGKIVLFGKPRKPEIHFEPDAKRFTSEDLIERSKAPIPGKKSPWLAKRDEWRKKRDLRKQIITFLEEQKVGVLLEGSDREHGTIRVHRGGSRKIGDSYGVPSLVVSIEQYNRIWRLVKKNIDVELEINVENTFFEQDSLGHNVIAELSGSDRKLKDEIVIIGAHLDSWHAGTGATDNGANCAVMMEVMRILKKLNLPTKRTIRLCLWDGEEQGYLGSEGYINKYIGDLENLELKAEHEKISAYFNLDNGSGKIRGIYLQGNDAARPILESLFIPFNDMGVKTVGIKNTSGTDHIPFNKIGLPGFQFIQDPINYMTRTHHTNMDVIDNVIESDLIHNSIIIASLVYHISMMDSRLPRKEMPIVEKKK